MVAGVPPVFELLAGGPHGQRLEQTLGPTPLVGKLMTVAFHLGFFAAVWALLAAAKSPEVGIQVCAAHVALLLGLWGPRKGCAHMIVPHL